MKITDGDLYQIYLKVPNTTSPRAIIIQAARLGILKVDPYELSAIYSSAPWNSFDTECKKVPMNASFEEFKGPAVDLLEYWEAELELSCLD